jgi:aminoglycoside phosphotransferase (APT) family kinase protein
LEIEAVARSLGVNVLDCRTLAGGFSHETCLLTLTDGHVVARLGGTDPVIEAAVMVMAAERVPVPRVLAVLPAAGPDARPMMALEYVTGTPLSEILDRAEPDDSSLSALGVEVGRVVASIGEVTFDHPGFFTDAGLTVDAQLPWSRQLPELVAAWLPKVPADRLDPATGQAWLELCVAHAPALTRIDHQARLVHADVNPKNVLVDRDGPGWRVSAMLDWEFSFSGSPYADAANMMRFGADYPPAFLTGFSQGFAANQPVDLPLPNDWAYLGHVLDMFALSDLLTRPMGNPVSDRAAAQIRRWIAHGVPRACH